ncbi:MAG TPA: hypothetical protein VF669_23735 [Tepidisphaeraceae bacterium]|jgi:hypothetical protein
MSLALLIGCSHPSPPATQYITDLHARLIARAREIGREQGYPLEDAVYQVRRDNGGFIVQVDRAPNYTGSGEPEVVVDGTFFVQFDQEEKPSTFMAFAKKIDLSTRPAASHSR